MDHADGFLQAIISSPNDVALRGVYADWLEEQGDGRSEFLRITQQLALLPYEDQRRVPLITRLQTLRRDIDPTWLAFVELRLPADLVEFLMAGKQLEIDADDCDYGAVALVPLPELKLERFPVETGSLPGYEQDPHHPGANSYLVLGVNLVLNCTGDYDPVGILMWLPAEGRYGMWDSSHCGIRMFGADVTWHQIAAEPVSYFHAMWTNAYSPPVEDLVPWPTHPYHIRQVYDPQPA